MAYTLGVDLGMSGICFVLMDAASGAVGESAQSKPYAAPTASSSSSDVNATPAPSSWREQDPLLWFQAFEEAVLPSRWLLVC